MYFKDDTLLVITTPETAAKFYKDNLINEKFITYEKYDDGGPFPRTKNVYDSPAISLLKTCYRRINTLSEKMGCLIVDEAHKYTKISTQRCQALGAISSHNRYVLSGTLFDEPDIERILGYYVILHWPGYSQRSTRNY